MPASGDDSELAAVRIGCTSSMSVSLASTLIVTAVASGVVAPSGEAVGASLTDFTSIPSCAVEHRSFQQA
jgi:hypothetical protein